MKCTACGSSSLVEGDVIDSNGSPLGFSPSDLPMFKRIFGMSNRALKAYGCVHCHNLQFGVQFSEKDFERYQQFEGEQPGVLERISSDPKK